MKRALKARNENRVSDFERLTGCVGCYFALSVLLELAALTWGVAPGYYISRRWRFKQVRLLRRLLREESQGRGNIPARSESAACSQPAESRVGSKVPQDMSKKQSVKDSLERTPDEQAEFIAAIRQGLDELDHGERIAIEEVEHELPSWIIR
jgi:predicted transcriptional regulator